MADYNFIRLNVYQCADGVIQVGVYRAGSMVHRVYRRRKGEWFKPKPDYYADVSVRLAYTFGSVRENNSITVDEMWNLIEGMVRAGRANV